MKEERARSGAAVFRDRGVKMVGTLNRPAGRRRSPGVLLLHGFPGAEKNVDLQRYLLARGVASLAPHFRGAWGSDGVYRFTDLPAQAASALRHLAGQDFVDPRRLAVFGFSMGGWTALNLAAGRSDLRGVAALAPVGGPEMVGRRTPDFLRRNARPLKVRSAAALYRDFEKAVTTGDPARKVLSLRCPLLLVHGEEDDVVDAGSSLRIFAAAPRPKRLMLIPGAAHDFLAHREKLVRLVGGWLAGKLKANARRAS